MALLRYINYEWGALTSLSACVYANPRQPVLTADYMAARLHDNDNGCRGKTSAGQLLLRPRDRRANQHVHICSR